MWQLQALLHRVRHGAPATLDEVVPDDAAELALFKRCSIIASHSLEAVIVDLVIASRM